ncbi:transposable element Tcb2 transposase [Trichonephila clavipes]|uniref:Transposable element Tcb2 transposase n=1 Tax=Trichonephila clavipes TaxID=2585209 RepID=A0A8X6SAG6_TRICX|nr:transposable element Tcb2 transposase [Trichonephila clavipes]
MREDCLEKGLFASRSVLRTGKSVKNVRDHRDWSMDQWVTVPFIDESLFSRTSDSRRTFIWREAGTRYMPSNVQEIDHYGSGASMVWAGIKLDGRTHLHVFERGNSDYERYQDKVL